MRPSVLFLAATLLPFPALAETVSTPADRTGLALTIYQGDLGLVRDRRGITLDKGAADLVVEGVARRAQAGSAALTAPGLAVRVHGFELEGLDAERLLTASIGREVTVVWNEQDGTRERAMVLAAGPVPVFRIGDKIVAAQPQRVLFDSLPTGMRALPAWRGMVESVQSGRREADLSYATGGLDWRPAYTAELGDDKITLSAWASLTNASGADFPESNIQVVAGTLNRAAAPPPLLKMARAEMAMASAPMADAARDSAGPYHVYTLGGPVTLRHGDTRQVALMAPASVKVDRSLELDPLPPHAWQNRWTEPQARHPVEIVRFKNNLGQPLPAGTIRVTARGKDGAPLLLGEDDLAATPAGAPARIVLGEAFDVTATRTQSDFQRIAPEVTEAAWEVRLANGGDAPAKVVVRERFHGDWLVVEESVRHAKADAFTAAWTVTVPAKGETVLTYRARVKG